MALAMRNLLPAGWHKSRFLGDKSPRNDNGLGKTGFRDGIAYLSRAKTNFHLLLRCRSGEGSGWAGGNTMYTGTLIDELTNAVERAERRSLQARSPEEKLAYFYAVAQSELAQHEPQLQGAA
jgi:hypothetical protein